MTDPSENNIVLTGPVDQTSHDVHQDLPQVGEWYWVSKPSEESETVVESSEPREWLGCVIHTGTNYAKLIGPCDKNSQYAERVHFDIFYTRCRREPRAAEIIAAKIKEQRELVSAATRQIAELAGRLQIGSTSPSEARELVAYRGGTMEEYKNSLVTARDQGIPELRAQIEEACSLMKIWMQAETIPLEADLQGCTLAIAKVESRISAVELYAGLVEESVMIREGTPAALDDPVHLFQRRHYMDEECLANYEAGGMCFADLQAFEAWLLRPDNFQRILPYPRCAVSFRVRRHKKEQEVAIEDFEDFVSFLFGEDDKDKRTYLYMRNGDQVHRLETSIDFGEKLFPDLNHMILKGREKLYAKRPWGKIEGLATEGEYLDVVKTEQKRDAELEGVTDFVEHSRIWHKYDRSCSSHDYVPWDASSVYYDDVTTYVKSQMEEHNRLVILLQGLFDRSEVFCPHPPCRLWDAADFARAVRLSYDDSRALSPGDAPDFESYRDRLNAHLKRGSLTVGQDEAWMRREAARYNNEYLSGVSGRYLLEKKRYRPEGDPGPGIVAVVKSFSIDKGCTFEWRRPRRRGSRDDQMVTDRITVPRDSLLCVDAYKPGDYKMFYSDPRTRAHYLQWAPLLLRAEDYYARKTMERTSNSTP